MKLVNKLLGRNEKNSREKKKNFRPFVHFRTSLQPSLNTLQLFSSLLSLPGNGDDAANNEANIKEEPVDPIELRRLQQLSSNGQFLNANYQFPNVNSNGTTFTPLTPASVLHHQPHVPGLKCRLQILFL